MSDSGLVQFSDRGGFIWIEIPAIITEQNRYKIENIIKNKLLQDNLKVVIDLSRIQEMYSAGINIIIGLWKYISLRKGYICVVNVNPEVKITLFAARLDIILPIFEDVDEFDAINGPPSEKTLDNHEKFTTSFLTDGNITITHLSGHMIVTNELSSFREREFSTDSPFYLFDFEGLEKIDSVGAALLVNKIKAIVDAQARCVIYNCNEYIRDFLQLIAVGDLVTFCKDQQAAMALVQGGQSE